MRLINKTVFRRRRNLVLTKGYLIETLVKEMVR